MAEFFAASVTTEGNISKSPIQNGKITFIRDKAEIYFDYGDKRVCYKDIFVLNTEQERISLLAPITNKFYFIEEKETLWRYTSTGWIQITNKLIEKTNLSEDIVEILDKIDNISFVSIDKIRALFDNDVMDDLEECNHSIATLDEIKALFI